MDNAFDFLEPLKSISLVGLTKKQKIRALKARIQELEDMNVSLVRMCVKIKPEGDYALAAPEDNSSRPALMDYTDLLSHPINDTP